MLSVGGVPSVLAKKDFYRWYHLCKHIPYCQYYICWLQYYVKWKFAYFYCKTTIKPSSRSLNLQLEISSAVPSDTNGFTIYLVIHIQLIGVVQHFHMYIYSLLDRKSIDSLSMKMKVKLKRIISWNFCPQFTLIVRLINQKCTIAPVFSSFFYWIIPFCLHSIDKFMEHK